MPRLLLLIIFLFSAALSHSALAQTDGLPARPTPFKFVNDQAQLMQPADAKKLESGLRRYADNTGTQVVVVTVPSLGGRTVADYGRALGTAWGVGQRDKNNGVIVLVSQQERQVTIQPGSGLASVITPEVTQRIIAEMTPGFKQSNYFAGLRAGLNTLMATANPNSKQQASPATAATSAAATAGTDATTPSSTNLSENGVTPAATDYSTPVSAPTEPAPSGPGMGTLLIGALVIGGILWFLVRMFRNRSAASASNPGNAGNPNNGTPNFLPNRPNGPNGGNYGGNNNNNGNGNFGQNSGGGGMGSMGGMLATGAAAAAGAYLGNRMASGHETSGSSLANEGTNAGFGGAGVAGAGAAGAGTAAAGDYFSNRDGGNAGEAGNESVDYFSDENTASDNNSDYFSADDNSSYDDTSSDDTGGGGFDSTDDNSGSW